MSAEKKKAAQDLVVGDVFLYTAQNNVVEVSVIGEKTDAPNQFGLPWFKYLCSAEGRTGYMTFGPDAMLRVVSND